MKFSISFAMLALPLLVTAGPLVERSNTPATGCNSGDIKCCNSVQDPTSTETAALLGLLGVPIQAALGALVGINCTPITIIGVGSSGCKQQTVCCTGNNFSNNLVNLGCSPVTVGL